MYNVFSLKVQTCRAEKHRWCVNWKREEQTSCGFTVSFFGHVKDLLIRDLKKDLRQKCFCHYHLKETNNFYLQSLD